MESVLENIEFDKDEKNYLAWLSEVPELGPVLTKLLLKEFKSAKRIFYAERNDLKKVNGLGDKRLDNIEASKDLEEIKRRFNKYLRNGTKCSFISYENYPCNLYEIYDPPSIIFFKGKLPEKNEPLVAIVGSRSPSEYGKNTAYNLAFKLASKGFSIVSGMATGIDAFAHMGAMDAGGKTYAVLGSGVDIVYPPNNINIYNKIIKNGGVISEQKPSTLPISGNFPSRNRIISGMSDAVIIVEARKKSGSLITADQAMEQGKDVFAVPGRLGDLLSEGCNSLIKEGAYILTGIQDLLDMPLIDKKIKAFNKIREDHVKVSAAKTFETIRCEEKNVYRKQKIDLCAKNSLDTTNYLLYSCLNLEPTSLNTIVEKSGLTPSEVAMGLLNLQIEEKVKEITPNMFIRIDV